MVAHGMITKQSILDESLFHECARELVFGNSNPNMQHIKDSWHLTENNEHNYKFKAQALRIS
ncbi:MAG: hypothetical protein DK304_000522 [Chloroflexi bacterium]|jgi:hypothetical protein|nr:MAG: hypothetical protein DK304_000522 [Chloroflexota bacterium]